MPLHTSDITDADRADVRQLRIPSNAVHCIVGMIADPKASLTALRRELSDYRTPTNYGSTSPMPIRLARTARLNDAGLIFGGSAMIKTEPEMVALAKQLIERPTATYDPSDLEDRYETRLRAMIDAKLRGEGIEVSEPEEPDRTNGIDLMAALRKSLGQEATEKKKAPQPPAKPSVLPLFGQPSRGTSGHKTVFSSSAGHRSSRIKLWPFWRQTSQTNFWSLAR